MKAAASEPVSPHLRDESEDPASANSDTLHEHKRLMQFSSHSDDMVKTIRRTPSIRRTKGALNEPLLGETPPLPHQDPEQDFLTVDWSRDHAMYRAEREEVTDAKLYHYCGCDDKHFWCCRWACCCCSIIPQRIQESVIRALDAVQGWILCLIIGIATGMTAAVVDIAVHWAVDFKLGHCESKLWLDYAFCCDLTSDVQNPIDHNCPKWQTWIELFGMGPTASNRWWVSYAMYVFLAGGMGALSAWLVATFAPYASGSGIPEVKTILGGVVIKRYLGLWTLLIKCVGLVLSVGSGLSLGKEGPYVHVSTCFANVLSRYFPKYRNNQAKKNEMLSAAAAAGVAVAFGAPIGGVLFSLEEVSTYFPHKTMWRAFFCAIVAALTLKVIDPSQTGKLVLFQIDYDVTWKWFEIVPFAMLGVLGGIIGVFFIRMNLRMARFRKFTNWRKHPVLEIAIVATLTAIINYLSDFLRGSDNSVLALLFQQCEEDDPLNLCDYASTSSTVFHLYITAGITLFMTIFTFGTAVPAGLFIPSMVTGACFGRLLGTIIRTMHHENPGWGIWDCTSLTHCITPGIYALVGAAAVLGGVTRMTVSLVVIMFELTGGLDYILPIMVGIIVSKWVGDAFGTGGIYDEYIQLHGYPFLESVEDLPMDVKASDVMSQRLELLTMHGHTVDDLFDKLHEIAANPLKINGFPVVTSLKDMLVVGYITRAELQEGLETALRQEEIQPTTKCYFAMLDMRFPRQDPYVDLRPWLHPTPLQIAESTPLYQVYNLFTRLGLRYALVTRFGKVVGIITKKDIHQWITEHFH